MTKHKEAQPLPSPYDLKPIESFNWGRKLLNEHHDNWTRALEFFKRAAIDGEAWANYGIAECYSSAKKHDLAKAYGEKLIDAVKKPSPDSADEQFMYGRACAFTKQKAFANDYYKAAAKQNHKQAEYQHIRNLTFSKDEKEEASSLEYMKKIAEAAISYPYVIYINANRIVGSILNNQKKYSEALKYIHVVADAGNMRAQWQLVKLYSGMKNIPVAKNDGLFLKYAELASKQGSDSAYHALTRYCRQTRNKEKRLEYWHHYLATIDTTAINSFEKITALFDQLSPSWNPLLVLSIYKAISVTRHLFTYSAAEVSFSEVERAKVIEKIQSQISQIHEAQPPDEVSLSNFNYLFRAFSNINSPSTTIEFVKSQIIRLISPLSPGIGHLIDLNMMNIPEVRRSMLNRSTAKACKNFAIDGEILETLMQVDKKTHDIDMNEPDYKNALGRSTRDVKQVCQRGVASSFSTRWAPFAYLMGMHSPAEEWHTFRTLSQYIGKAWAIDGHERYLTIGEERPSQFQRLANTSSSSTTALKSKDKKRYEEHRQSLIRIPEMIMQMVGYNNELIAAERQLVEYTLKMRQDIYSSLMQLDPPVPKPLCILIAEYVTPCMMHQQSPILSSTAMVISSASSSASIMMEESTTSSHNKRKREEPTAANISR